jgi:DNA-binding CsgD family transcriptional regulator
MRNLRHRVGSFTAEGDSVVRQNDSKEDSPVAVSPPPRPSYDEIYRYERELTPRQRQVIELISRGYTNAEIGARLGVSMDGAKWHVSEILSKLALSSREEVAEYWRHRNKMSTRFGRAMRALIAAPLLKWAGGSAAVATIGTVVVVVAVLAIQARSDEDMPPTAPGNVVDECPVVGAACEFAQELGGLLEAGDSGGLVSLAAATGFTCPGSGQAGAGSLSPLCDGASAGEVRQGFYVARAQSGDIFAYADPAEALARYADPFDPGRLWPAGGPLTLAGLLCPAGDAPCSERFIAVFDVDPQANQGDAVQVVRVDGEYRVVGIIYRGAQLTPSQHPNAGPGQYEMLFPGEGLVFGLYYPYPAEP